MPTPHTILATALFLTATLCLEAQGAPDPRFAQTLDQAYGRTQRDVAKLSKDAFWFDGALYIRGTSVDRERFMKTIERRYRPDTWRISRSNFWDAHNAPVFVRLSDGWTANSQAKVVSAAKKKRDALKIAAEKQYLENYLLWETDDKARKAKIASDIGPTVRLASVAIIQVMDGYVLAQVDGSTARIDTELAAGLIDGEELTLAIEPKGRYSYTSVNQSSRTVARYQGVPEFYARYKPAPRPSFPDKAVFISPTLADIRPASTEDVFAFLVEHGMDEVPQYRPSPKTLTPPKIVNKSAGKGLSRKNIGTSLQSKGSVELVWEKRSAKITLKAKPRPSDRPSGKPLDGFGG